VNNVRDNSPKSFGEDLGADFIFRIDRRYRAVVGDICSFLTFRKQNGCGCGELWRWSFVREHLRNNFFHMGQESSRKRVIEFCRKTIRAWGFIHGKGFDGLGNLYVRDGGYELRCHLGGEALVWERSERVVHSGYLLGGIKNTVVKMVSNAKHLRSVFRQSTILAHEVGDMSVGALFLRRAERM